MKPKHAHIFNYETRVISYIYASMRPVNCFVSPTKFSSQTVQITTLSYSPNHFFLFIISHQSFPRKCTAHYSSSSPSDAFSLMDKETHDFMNVDSFSELPFLRPSPPVKDKGIRLFGKQFSSGDIHKVVPSKSESLEINARGEFTTTSKENENGESNRKFECHYCCRNFPTSQALGGHQNAHKRERQQAKRAHLQSARYPEAHVYGTMNYNRFVSAPSPATMPYHSSSSWSSSNVDSVNSRFYGGPGFYNSQQPQPITGSPLALWGVPSVHSSSGYRYEHAMNPPPLFANDEMRASSNIGSSSLQNRYLYESKASHVKDNVSLDLHL